MKRYALEIYPPGNSGRDVACFVESDSPLLAIHAGDLIGPGSWDSHWVEALRTFRGDFPPHGILLRVSGVLHMIIARDNGVTQHKLGVFTEALDDIDASRPVARATEQRGFTDSGLLHRFRNAVETLAAGTGRLQDRLASAFCDQLVPLHPEDFPPGDEELRTLFGSIEVYLTRKEAKGDEGTAAATAAVLPDEHAVQIAKAIVSISHRLEELFER